MKPTLGQKASRADKLDAIYARLRWEGFVSGIPAPACPVCGCVIWRAAGKVSTRVVGPIHLAGGWRVGGTAADQPPFLVDGTMVARARHASSPARFSRGSFFCYECLDVNGRLVMASAALIPAIEDALIDQLVDHTAAGEHHG
jgi:hypothetical protein